MCESDFYLCVLMDMSLLTFPIKVHKGFCVDCLLATLHSRYLDSHAEIMGSEEQEDT